MTGPALDGEALRALVRETLREALPDLLADRPGGAPATRPAEQPEDVVVRTDADLDAFAGRVLALADDPVAGPQLRAGRIRFRLASAGHPAGTNPAATHRVERGAVLERHVRAAAAAGARLVAGPGAVVTPLARERARAAGVEIVVERRQP